MVLVEYNDPVLYEVRLVFKVVVVVAAKRKIKIISLFLLIRIT